MDRPACEPQTARLLAQADALARRLGAGQTEPLSFARRFTEELMAAFAGPPPAAVSTSVETVEVGTRGLPVHLYRPSAVPAEEPLALVIFFHGGGWSVGSADSYAPFVQSLCAEAGVLFANVDYRLAPEWPFPAALTDCRAAVLALIKNAARYGADPARVAVMGDSAGGNLAAVVSWMLHRQRDHRLKAQYLLYPFLDLRADHDAYPSRRKFGDGRFLIGVKDLELAAEWYVPSPGLRADPRVSPILLPDLSSLPPTVILTAGCDPLADEGRLFAERLAQAGVQICTHHVPDTIHGFLPFGVLDVAQATRRWLAADIRTRLRGAARRPHEEERKDDDRAHRTQTAEAGHKAQGP